MPSPAREPVYRLTGPDGRTLSIPVDYQPATDPYPALTQPERVRGFFEQQGYVVLRGLVPPPLCDQTQAGFDAEVRPHRGVFRRHEKGGLDPHVFTDHGFMKYPIMNIQDLSRRRFPRFRRSGLDLATHPQVQTAFHTLFQEPGQLIHTMYFEGNQKTWAHQDSHYIDSETIGGMIGIWIALEDIHPGAGRFFVYPGSHKLPMHRLGQGSDMDPNGQAYKDFILEVIRTQQLACQAPALRKGDAIMWSSATIHGSLETVEPQYSRRCVTAHYIPRSKNPVWFHTHQARTRTERINGVEVHHHMDQNYLPHRVRFELEARFPGLLRLEQAARATGRA